MCELSSPGAVLAVQAFLASVLLGHEREYPETDDGEEYYQSKGYNIEIQPQKPSRSDNGDEPRRKLEADIFLELGSKLLSILRLEIFVSYQRKSGWTGIGVVVIAIRADETHMNDNGQDAVDQVKYPEPPPEHTTYYSTYNVHHNQWQVLKKDR